MEGGRETFRAVGSGPEEVAMKVMTILGTRPEIIRLSRIIPAMDARCDHVLVHTGQNYDDCLSGQFFEELGIRKQDHNLTTGRGKGGQQIGEILSRVSQALLDIRPDKVLILGDTNSGLSALVAKRMGIPVYHLEAGNRCYDDRVPEEVNRRVIDHCSDVLMPYTERSRANLLREGIAGERIFVVGNPIKEVIDQHGWQIRASCIVPHLGLTARGYLLATVHRAETVDNPARLATLLDTLRSLVEATGLKIVWSLHPHTKERLKSGFPFGVECIEPPGFFDFIRLERNAACVLTDSGTVQEECCIQGVPCVVLRDVTERPETLECGAVVLSGIAPPGVLRAVEAVAEGPRNWTPPEEYMRTNVSETVARIVLGQ
jgi:UDP-N-acetylglucosamine 2-epimerase (non-hydrolysing)